MDKEGIYRLVGEVYALDERQKRLFIEALLDRLSDKGRQKWFEWTCYALYPQSRWLKVDRWMEGLFRRDMSRRPRKVAYMCINYFRINTRMLPFLIKKAQRIKKRVYIRMKRAGRFDNG